MPTLVEPQGRRRLTAALKERGWRDPAVCAPRDPTLRGRSGRAAVFKVVDTLVGSRTGLGTDASVAAQAEYAIEAADRRSCSSCTPRSVPPTPTRRSSGCCARPASPCSVLCANKVDGPSGEADASYLWSLGLGEPHPVSLALHGRGTGDMLDRVLEALPEAPAQTFGTAVGGPRRIALIGRPNVGKSTADKVAGEERVVVNELAGTTRDPVDELIELGGVTWKFVDTAGIRKRVHLQQGADYYASLRTAAAVEKAEVAVILINAAESISVLDQRIVTMAVEAGRALVLAYNKWDTLDEERRYYLEREIETELGQVAWAPRVNVSAHTGRHMEKLVPAIETALAGWETRVPTGRRTPSSASWSPPTRTPCGRQAAAHPLRHPGGHQAPAVRALRLRLHRGGLPALHRAPAARGVQLRGHPHPHPSVRVREKRGQEEVRHRTRVRGRPHRAAPLTLCRRQTRGPRSGFPTRGRRQCRRDVCLPGVPADRRRCHSDCCPTLAGAARPRAVGAVQPAADGTAEGPRTVADGRPVPRGAPPKAVNPSSSSPLRSPGSDRKDLTYSA
ncbi:GTPase Der [Streptomyces hirsutus]